MAIAIDRSRIQGWGADLDPANRPAVPKERTPPRIGPVAWTHPEQQPVRQTVFHSTERPNITPVFGTSVPPSGVSGILRGWAFKYSENDLRHWFILLAADRINVVEGLFSDLAQGHVPNVFAEMGIKSEWKYNRKGLVVKAATTVVVLGAITALIMAYKRKD